MNDVKLSGRLVRDPELKHTPNGVPVATFSLAVDRKFNREEADFVPIVAWRKTAEFADSKRAPEDRPAGSVAAEYMENGGFEELDGEDGDLPF